MSRRSVRRTSAVAVAAVSVLGAAATAAPAALASPSSSSVTITNTLPNWLPRATPVASPDLVAGSATQTVRVLLAPRGGLAAEQAAAAAVSDPSSAQYRHFLTEPQFQAQYGPTKAAADSVSAYLKSHGLTITAVEGQRRYVEAKGTTSQLASAFGTSLRTYRHDGQTVTANATAVRLPAAVGTQVLTVTGLDTTVFKKTSNAVRDGAQTASSAPDLKVDPPAGFRNARPCNINYGNLTADSLPGALPYAPCGYTGPSYRAAYEGDTTLDGSGVTIAIIDAYAWNHIYTDANHYASINGDGSFAPGQFTQNNPTVFTNKDQCGPSGWSGEETLDVEASHAMAPGADIRYYGAASCFDNDLQAAMARVLDEGKAQIITNSYGDSEGNQSTANVTAWEQNFLQASIQGVSVLFSSGDNGDELAHTGIRQADYPASDPYITSAGGTATAIAYGQLLGQTGWGTHNYTLSSDGKSWVDTGYLYGAGGGFSALFNRPSYQDGTIPAGSSAGRAVPDIAMDADPQTGMLIGQTQSFPDGVYYDQYRIGGTSLASPLLAGMFALAAQNAGGGLGFLNPTLYKAGKNITDVIGRGIGDPGVVRVNYNNGVDTSAGTTPFLRSFNQNSSLYTKPGWDTTTGLGVPNSGIFSYLAK